MTEHDMHKAEALIGAAQAIRTGDADEALKNFAVVTGHDLDTKTALKVTKPVMEEVTKDVVTPILELAEKYAENAEKSGKEQPALVDELVDLAQQAVIKLVATVEGAYGVMEKAKHPLQQRIAYLGDEPLFREQYVRHWGSPLTDNRLESARSNARFEGTQALRNANLEQCEPDDPRALHVKWFPTTEEQQRIRQYEEESEQ